MESLQAGDTKSPAVRQTETAMSNQTNIEEHACAFVNEPTQRHRDAVVLGMEPIIRSIIAKLHLPSDEMAHASELFQVGVIAVLQSLDQFDQHSGARFVTFSYARIRGEIVDYLRRLDPLPRRRRAKVAAVRHEEDRMAQVVGCCPAPTLVATRMGITVDEYNRVKHDAWRRHGASLTQSADDEFALVDVMADASSQERFEEYEWTDVRQHLARAKNQLSERERTILDLYFSEGLTQTQIGELLGITEARISQIRRKSLQKLGSLLEPELKYAA